MLEGKNPIQREGGWEKPGMVNICSSCDISKLSMPLEGYQKNI